MKNTKRKTWRKYTSFPTKAGYAKDHWGITADSLRHLVRKHNLDCWCLVVNSLEEVPDENLVERVFRIRDLEAETTSYCKYFIDINKALRQIREALEGCQLDRPDQLLLGLLNQTICRVAVGD